MPSITGLTAAEVEARRAAGQTNQPPKSQTKTTGEIVRDNVCTYFNLVFLVLAVMLALVHSWLNMGFLGSAEAPLPARRPVVRGAVRRPCAGRCCRVRRG